MTSAPPSPPRVLLLGRPSARALASRELARAWPGATLREAPDLLEVEVSPTPPEFDVAVLDLGEQGDHLHGLERLRLRYPSLPVVCLSGPIEPERVVQILHAGARDLVIATRAERLIPALEGALHLPARTEVADDEAPARSPGGPRTPAEAAQRLEALGLLAGGIAHDFNNMLTVIMGHAQLLAERLEPSHRRHVDAILRAGVHSAALTHKLLTYGRASRGGEQAADLVLLVNEVRQLMERVIGEDVTLHVEHHQPALPVRLDPHRLQQAVLNLAINARHAMPRGGQLTLATDRSLRSEAAADDHGLRPGAYARLSVADTGVGMDAETAARIFEPFFTTKPAGVGTGLGLSSVRGFVRESGGSVEVQSAPGAGATFHLYLPLEPVSG